MTKRLSSPLTLSREPNRLRSAKRSGFAVKIVVSSGQIGRFFPFDGPEGPPPQPTLAFNGKGARGMKWEFAIRQCHVLRFTREPPDSAYEGEEGSEREEAETGERAGEREAALVEEETVNRGADDESARKLPVQVIADAGDGFVPGRLVPAPAESGPRASSADWRAIVMPLPVKGGIMPAASPSAQSEGSPSCHPSSKADTPRKEVASIVAEASRPARAALPPARR